MLLTQRNRDAHLVRQVLKGRKEAFRGLVEGHLSTVQALAYAKMGNRDDALDASQEAFIKAYEKLNTLREPARFGEWLRAIVYNVCMSMHRARERRSRLTTTTATQTATQVDDPGRRELRELLHKQILQLDEIHREVLLLHYFAGQSSGLIAKTLGITPNAVKKRLHRARQALSEKLTDDIGGLLEEERPTARDVGAVVAIVSAHTAGWEKVGVPATLSLAGLGMAIAKGGTGMKVFTCIVLALVAALGGTTAWQIMQPDAKDSAPAVTVLASSQPPEATRPSEQFRVGDDQLQSKVIETATAGSASEAGGTPGNADASENKSVQSDSAQEQSTEEPEPPEGTLTGVVYDSNGNPVPGATVWAASFDLCPIAPHETTTDTDGRFALPLSAGSWSVRARLGRNSGEANNEHGSVKIKAEGVTEPVSIHLQPRGALRGQVFDTITGKPIAFAEVWLDNGVLAKADLSGRYTFEGLVTQNHYCYVIAPGYERKRFLFDTSLREDAQLDLRVGPAGMIRGRVVDQDGNPVSNAHIWNPGSGNTIALAARFAKTDRYGYFERDGYAFGVPCRLEASKDGYEEDVVRRIVVTQEEPVAQVDFVLTRKEGRKPAAALRHYGQPAPSAGFRDLTGIVKGPDGKPVQGARVKWGATMYEEFKNKAETDADGAFTLADVPDRAGYITVIANKLAPVFPQVEAGKDATVTVNLTPGRWIEGTVLDETGNPLEAITVIPVMKSPDAGICNPLWLTQRKGKTDSQGKFRIEALPESPVQFDIMGAGFSEKRNLDLVFNSADNTVALKAIGSIRGKVVNAQGLPVRDFRILIQIPKERKPEDEVGGFFAGFEGIGISFTTDDGIFVVSDLVAGHIHRVVAVAEGYTDAVAERVTAEPINHVSPAENLTLRMGAPAPAMVHVVDASEAPLAGATALFVETSNANYFDWGYDDYGWNRTVKARTNQDGWCSIPSVGFDQGMLIIRASGFARQRIPWSANGQEIAVTMRPETVFTGQVENENGQPISECQVSVNWGKGDHISQVLTPADNGVFRFDELPADTYSINVSFDRQQLYTGNVQLGEGEVVERILNPRDSGARRPG